MWRLTRLIAGQDEDIVAPATEAVFGPVFTRYYHEQSETPAGDVIRGIDWLVTKGPGSRTAGLAMAYKLIEAAQTRWRAVNAPHLVVLVRAGSVFH